MKDGHCIEGKAVMKEGYEAEIKKEIIYTTYTNIKYQTMNNDSLPTFKYHKIPNQLTILAKGSNSQ